VNLGGLLAVVVGRVDVGDGFKLTVIEFTLIERSTARRRDEPTQRVVGVVVPLTVVVVLRAHRAATRQLQPTTTTTCIANAPKQYACTHTILGYLGVWGYFWGI